MFVGKGNVIDAIPVVIAQLHTTSVCLQKGLKSLIKWSSSGVTVCFWFGLTSIHMYLRMYVVLLYTCASP